MAKYLIKASYTVEGAKGVVKEGGSGRVASARAAIEGLGGKLETFYFAFGKNDAFLIMDVPDNVTAAALALRVNAAGGASCETVVLMTPEEVDRAVKMGVSYRPPGA